MNALAPVLASVSVKSPEGAAWEFLVLFLVVIIGPPLLEHARLPGIVGLLLGGYVIGSHGLNLIGAGNTTVPELGQLGLLYLMFVAGVELDLGLVRIHRRAVGLFGLLAFAVPMAFGSVVGFALNWEAAAALLLGSLMASHTLLVYPAVRNAGLAAHRAVATAVGATVITDTASLVVLAFVSGSQLEGGSAASIALQVVFGLAVLVIFAFLVLPRLVRLAFRYLGTDRIVRYLLAIAAFLAAATLAAMVGIEGIVGAFFAGLGLNRLVPNEGPLMDRIDFFGSAVFVPIFLVSVGMLLQPRVMVQGETLKLAGLFVVAALGGKAVATAVSARVLQLSRQETALMWGLTLPQAAATLAATVIGFDIGLFDQSVVNAVLVLILVSIVVATLVVERVKGDVAVPHEDGQRLGHRVLVALEDPGQAETAFEVAARVAAVDTGVVRGLLSCPPGERSSHQAGIAELKRVGFSIGVDTDPTLLVTTSFAEGIVNAVITQEPSLVLVCQRRVAGASAVGGPGEAVAAATSAPVAIVVGQTDRIAEVLLIDAERPSDEQPQIAGLAAELAARIAGKNVEHRSDESKSFGDLRPGQLCIAPAHSWQVLAASDPPEGAALMMVLESQPPPPLEEDRLWGTAAV
jgi:Kef-type K+ transport system membrane component KefB